MTAGPGHGGSRWWPATWRRPTGRERWFYLLISPWLIGLVVVQAGPALATAGAAFTTWEPPLAPRWSGLDNFALLAADGRFARALQNTGVYTIATVVPSLGLGLAIALLLRGVRRGGAALRATVFLPVVVTGVATALMWGWLLNPRFGLVNTLLGTVGVDGPAWLRDPAWAMPAMVAIGTWNLGVNVVVFLAALRTVPVDLREAAVLDGAGRPAVFRHVTWPALTPIAFYLAVVNAIGAVHVFTPTYLLTGGGPDDATLTAALYTYQTAFDSGRLGLASAMTVVVLAGVAILTLVQFRVGGRRVHYLGADG